MNRTNCHCFDVITDILVVVSVCGFNKTSRLHERDHGGQSLRGCGAYCDTAHCAGVGLVAPPKARAGAASTDRFKFCTTLYCQAPREPPSPCVQSNYAGSIED